MHHKHRCNKVLFEKLQKLRNRDFERIRLPFPTSYLDIHIRQIATPILVRFKGLIHRELNVSEDVLLWVEKKLLLVEEEPVLSFTTELLRRQVSEFRQRAEKAINLVVQFAQFRSPFMALRVYLYK